MRKIYIISLLVLISSTYAQQKDNYCNTDGHCTNPQYLKIFATVGAYQGNIAALDSVNAICSRESACGVGNICRAVIAINNPTTNYLHPFTTYLNKYNDIIGTTNAASVFRLTYADTLLNGLAPGSHYWTALNSDWSTYSHNSLRSSNNCENMTINNYEFSANVGNGDAKNMFSINDQLNLASFACNNYHPLLCVQYAINNTDNILIDGK